MRLVGAHAVAKYCIAGEIYSLHLGVSSFILPLGALNLASHVVLPLLIGI
jgi:hypothetical protein